MPSTRSQVHLSSVPLIKVSAVCTSDLELQTHWMHCQCFLLVIHILFIKYGFLWSASHSVCIVSMPFRAQSGLYIWSICVCVCVYARLCVWFCLCISSALQKCAEAQHKTTRERRRICVKFLLCALKLIAFFIAQVKVVVCAQQLNQTIVVEERHI